MPGMRLLAVYDRPSASAQPEAPQVPFYDDFAKVLELPTVQVVVICLPSHLHAEFGILAAKAGKHVIVEKPLDSNAGEARRLIQECGNHSVILAPISQYRFSNGILIAREIIQHGRLGNVHLLRASVKWYRDDQYYVSSDWRARRELEGGGALINQAIHAVDILQHLAGVPTSVMAMTKSTRPAIVETEDAAVALLQFPGGILATVEAATFAPPGFNQRFELYGTNGTCIIEDNEVTFWHHSSGAPCPDIPYDLASSTINMKTELFRRQYENILSALRGNAPLAVSPADALQALLTIQALYHSAETGNSIVPPKA